MEGTLRPSASLQSTLGGLRDSNATEEQQGSCTEAWCPSWLAQWILRRRGSSVSFTGYPVDAGDSVQISRLPEGGGSCCDHGVKLQA